MAQVLGRQRQIRNTMDPYHLIEEHLRASQDFQPARTDRAPVADIDVTRISIRSPTRCVK